MLRGVAAAFDGGFCSRARLDWDDADGWRLGCVLLLIVIRLNAAVLIVQTRLGEVGNSRCDV